MKVFIFAIVSVFILSTDNLAQTDYASKSPVRLSGRVIETKIDESGSSILVRLKVSFELRNIGSRNVIFWNRDASETMGESKIVRVIASKSNSFSAENIIAKNVYEPSDLYGKTWDDLRTSLDLDTPPDGNTITLKPNQTWSFVSDCVVVVKKEKVVFENTTDTGSLKRLPEVWIKVFYKSWSPNIEPRKKFRASDLEFGNMLQQRWKPYGHLFLESIVSEPIELPLD